MKNYDVAAYVYPAYTGTEGRSRIFWPEGNGEWETVRAATARFPGHDWPRRPIWGYVDEADPYVMEMQIEAASRHGINVFIYDWYWYDDRPFLEGCLTEGFLKAKNRSKMKFYLMWANHDVTYGWSRKLSEVDTQTKVWTGLVSKEQFQRIGRRWVEKFFSLPEYYRIDGKPVLSIYDLQQLIDSFGGAEQARQMLLWLDKEAQNAGLPGIHYQYIRFGEAVKNVSGVDAAAVMRPEEVVSLLPFSSVTHYQFVHFTDMNREFDAIMEDVEREWAYVREAFGLPYYPHVSIGWDNTPRFPSHTDLITKNNTPDAFSRALAAAKRFAAQYNETPLITINSWNEWTEGSCLQPDDRYGYGYLEAVRNVFAVES